MWLVIRWARKLNLDAPSKVPVMAPEVLYVAANVRLIFLFPFWKDPSLQPCQYSAANCVLFEMLVYRFWLSDVRLLCLNALFCRVICTSVASHPLNQSLSCPILLFLTCSLPVALIVKCLITLDVWKHGFC